MSWSDKYKRSINCDNPQGFSQKAHCAARKKRKKGEETKSKSPFNEMHQVKTHRSVEEIAKKHRLEVSFIKKQLEMGIPIEHEHTKDKDLATDIALQHLGEIPDYYTRLKKMESDAKKEHKKFKDITEGTLYHWFHGSKSKEGKPGWVKPDGSPCANEPGETKTPKCFSSGRLRALKRKGKKGIALIRSAVRRKRKKDKGQQAKSGAAAPTNVPTFAKGKKDPNYVKAEPGIKETMELNEAKKDRPGKGSGTKDACYHKVKARYDVWPSAYASGALVKCRRVGADNWGTKSEETSLNYDWDTPIRERPDRYCPKCEKLELRSECKYGPKYWDMYSLPAELIKNKQDYKITMPHPGPDAIPAIPSLSLNQIKYNPNRPHPANEEKDHEYSMARSELSTIISAAKRLRKKMKKGEGNIEAWVQSKITKAADYIDTAADYVDSGEMKAENVSIEDARGKSYAEFIDLIKPEPLKPSKGIGSELLGESISPTIPGGQSQYKYPSLPKEDPDNVPIRLIKGKEPKLPLAQKNVKTQIAHYEPEGEIIDEAGKKCWKGYEKKGTQELFGKKYNRCVKAESFSNWRLDFGLSEDWQKVNRQDKTDGLSQAAVNAYRRENPGSKLQTAVTEKKPKGKRAKRRANFCRRMKGMKSKLTSAKTARDPDSRINKALSRWRCR
jgi:hypothetical protein